MQFAAFVSGVVSLVFALILIWGIVSMVKEQRRQSLLLSKILQHLSDNDRPK